MTAMKDAALAYAAAGWHVFPVGAGDDRKAPLTSHGLKDATTDAAQIEEWWARWPEANVAGATEPSGLAVVDVDDQLGLTSFEAEHQPLPPTLVVRTPRGGEHKVYAGDIKSTTSKLSPGVDTRGRGGYVVLPPSTNGHGAWAWANQEPIAQLPRWVAEVADPPREEREPSVPDGPVEANDRWGKRVLDGELARVAVAPEGTRNATLFEAACNVFEAVKGGHIEPDVAHESLAAVGERAGLDGWEVERTLASAWDRTGERHPEPTDDGPTLLEAPPVGAPTEDDTDLGFDVLRVGDLGDIPPPQWLLDQRIPEGITALIGQPKTGKTFTAIDWACTVAATRGPVLYWISEGIKGFARRVLTWQANFPQADLSRLYIVPKVPHLMDPDHVRRFYTTVRRIQPVLTVTDTLSRATPGVNENDSENFTMVVEVLEQVRDAYGTNSLVLHHTNTQGKRPRGSNALDGAVDALWRADRDEDTPDTFQLVCVYMRDAEEPTPVLGRIVASAGSAIAFPSEYPRVVQQGAGS